MDLNRFTANVQSTTKQMKTSGRSNHIMLSVLSSLDEAYAEGQGILGDLSAMHGAHEEKIMYVESVLIEKHKQMEKVDEANQAVEDLRAEQERKMEEEMDKMFGIEDVMQDLVAEENEAKSQYDEAEQDLSYWEGQAIQIINTLNQQISSLESGAEALGLDISTEKYHNLVSKLEDDVNHERITWVGVS